VIVASDTDGLISGGFRSGYSKVLYLPHANVAFATRGDRRLFGEFFARFYFSSTDISSYDSVADRFEDAVRDVCSLAALQNAPELDFYLVAAGWSDRQGRMAACSCTGTSTDSTFTVEDIWGGRGVSSRIAPWEFDEPVPDMLSDRDILAVARRQATWLRSQ